MGAKAVDNFNSLLPDNRKTFTVNQQKLIIT